MSKKNITVIYIYRENKKMKYKGEHLNLKVRKKKRKIVNSFNNVSYKKICSLYLLLFKRLNIFRIKIYFFCQNKIIKFKFSFLYDRSFSFSFTINYL
jgi:hypothetical protein